jgi:hypothetical protein
VIVAVVVAYVISARLAPRLAPKRDGGHEAPAVPPAPTRAVDTG